MSLPERLGRLRRVDRLGVGGFATVWLYHDDELQSDVAVKALAENWAQRIDIRERFLEEARILRKADSDHVVRVYDIGEEDGTPYFVMTYADQGSLAPMVGEDRQVAPGMVVELMGQAGDGVAVLHDQGVLHRDIKPPNLLLRTHGSAVRLLVADLGVAKAVAHASGLTQVVGTPAYMAPEQTSGVGIDRRADIHALGAVAYHLLTGQQVRTGGFASFADPEPPPPISTYADVPAELDAAVMRSIAIDPDDRFDDVREFVAALRQAVVDDPHPVDSPAGLGQPGSGHSGERIEIADLRGAAGRRSGTRTGEANSSSPLRLVGWCLLVLLIAGAVAYGVTRLVI